jgi:hypothetical protein
VKDDDQDDSNPADTIEDRQVRIGRRRPNFRQHVDGAFYTGYYGLRGWGVCPSKVWNEIMDRARKARGPMTFVLPGKPPRRSLVPVSGDLRQTLDRMSIASLPATIELLPGKLTIHCRNGEHLLEHLVQLAKALDNDYETLQRLIDAAPRERPVGSQTPSAPANLRGEALG